MTIITEFAPAKINLTLEVLGKRPDGYHELNSLVAFADVGDVVTLDTSKPVGVTVSGPFANSIAGANLIETTLRHIADVAPALQLGAVRLEKNLPVAAGIGGGSADAAAVIRAVQRANANHARAVDWKHVGLRIGSDVPVCLVSRLAWMRGAGEIVAPLTLPEAARIDAIIVNPLMPVPDDKTARVFRAFASEPDFREGRPEVHPSIRNRDELLQVACREWRNDLQIAALKTMPAIESVMNAIGGVMRPGGRVARMSGAGPTCFAILDDSNDAVSAAATLQRARPDWWVKAVTLG